MLVGDLNDHGQRVVERAVDLDDLGAVGDRAGQFARRDLSLRDEHNGFHPGPGGVGRGRGSGIAGRGTDDSRGAASERFADGRESCRGP